MSELQSCRVEWGMITAIGYLFNIYICYVVSYWDPKSVVSVKLRASTNGRCSSAMVSEMLSCAVMRKLVKTIYETDAACRGNGGM